MSDLFSVVDKVVLVTGSSRGLGNGLARGYAEAGARVIINGTSEASVAPAVAAIRQAGGGQAYGYPFDVTDATAVGLQVEAIEREVGSIDVLVNNAGIQRRAPLEEMPLEDWQAILDVNLSAVFRVTQIVARGMIRRERGVIINITSLNVEGSRPTIAPYCASKGGLDALTRSMAAEWGKYGIRANAIAPGYFATDMNQPLIDDPDFNAWVKGNVPLARWGDPSELVGAAIFLSSAASSYVTGRTIHVDGGWRASL
jgi:gluconate 5-dehydrogenase